MLRVELEQLTKELQSLNRSKPLYKVLKRELSILGYWRNKPRGNPAKGYKAMKENKQGGEIPNEKDAAQKSTQNHHPLHPQS